LAAFLQLLKATGREGSIILNNAKQQSLGEEQANLYTMPLFGKIAEQQNIVIS
jgi:hypothetical protein